MMGSKLSEVVIDIIKRHQVATSVAPRHIIFYFSSISEGQFSMVMKNSVLLFFLMIFLALLFKIADIYMRAINTGLSSLSLGKKPNVTALAVSRDHNERIYKLVCTFVFGITLIILKLKMLFLIAENFWQTCS